MPIRITDDLLLETAATAASGEIAGETEHTVGFWMYLETGTELSSAFAEQHRFGRSIFFSKSTSTTTNRFRFLIETEASGNISYTINSLPYDSWVFVLLRTKSGATEVYVNDVLEGTSKTNAYTQLTTSTVSNTIRFGCRTTNGIIAGGIRYNGMFQMNHYISNSDKTSLFNNSLRPQDVVGPTFSFVVPMNNEDTGDAPDITDTAFLNIGSASYDFISYAASSGDTRVVGSNHTWDVEPLAIQSATIEDAEKNDIVMVFNNVVTGTNLGFTIAGTTSTAFSSISGSGTNTITGVLANAATDLETVTISYVQATGDIVDGASSELGDLTNYSVTNNIIGIVLPTLDTITIEEANPNNVVMVFSEIVTGTNLGFTLSGTTSTTFSSISGSGTNTITGVLSDNVIASETVLLSYSESTGDIVDPTLDALADITNQAITNNTIEKILPTLQSALVNDENPNDIVMTFSEIVTGTNLGFTIAGTTSTSFSSISGSGTNTITGVLASSAIQAETITVSYVEVTGDIIDAVSNALADITNLSVTNTVGFEGIAPTVILSTVEFYDPRKLIVSFDEPVSGTNLGFTITGTTSTTFDSIEFFPGDRFVGTLSDDVVFGETITVSYVESTGDIVDTVGNALADFSSFAVINNVDDIVLTNQLIVYGHGNESLVEVTLNSGSSAWVEGSYVFDQALFATGFKIFADGIEVENIEIKALTYDRTLNPQSAELWPHISYDKTGIVGNKIQFWVKHDMIELDQAITWNWDKDIVTQGAFDSGDIVGVSADFQYSTYVPEITDRLQADAKGMFLSHDDGTLPKLPYLERNLGVADQTYADLATIPFAQVNANSSALFCIDIELLDDTITPEGILFEVGDSSAGFSVIFSGGNLIVKAGDSTTNFTLTSTSGSIGEITYNRNITIGIHLNGVSGIDYYIEGCKIRSQAGDVSGWISAAQDGSVGQANGDYMNSDGIPSIPARANITLHSGVRFYENPTLDIDIDVTNSKEWFQISSNFTVLEVYNGQPWESDYTDYIYAASDFADIRNPGVINESKSIQFARDMMSNSTSGFTISSVHSFIAYKSGEVWGTTDNDKSNDRQWRAGGSILITTAEGESRTRGHVVFRYGGSSLISFDWSGFSTSIGLPGAKSLIRSWDYIEDRIFKFIGNNVSDGLGITISGSAESIKEINIGGIWFQNIAGNAIKYVQTNEVTTRGAWRDHTWGEMNFDNIGQQGSRSACISTGSTEENGHFVRFQLGKSYYKNGYNLGGFNNTQAHSVYIKGWIPYMSILGGWHGAGPGGLYKMDSHENSIVEDFIGWSHKGGGGFHNNGTVSGVRWQPTSDRSERAGRHNSRSVFQNFIIANGDDWPIDTSSIINCEARFGILTSTIDQVSLFFKDGGTSNKEGEYGGDSYNSGFVEMTVSGANGVILRLASTDDRSINNSQAMHNCYLHNCLIMTGDGITGEALQIDAWTTNELYTESALAGRVTDFRVTRSHIAGVILEDDVAFADIDAAKLSLTDANGNVLGTDVTQGSVDTTLQTDALLDYFVSNGYADYDAVELAIANSWLAGWDNMSSNLKTDVVIEAVATRLRPTNLNEATYDGIIPGYQEIISDTTSPTIQSATVENSNPNDVIIVFSEIITTTNIGFSLSGTTSTTPDSISGSGTNTITATFADSILFSETVLLRYSEPSGDTEDSSGNRLVSFSNFSITNNVISAEQDPPVPSSFSPENLSINNILSPSLAVTFDETIKSLTGNVSIIDYDTDVAKETISITNSLKIFISGNTLNIYPSSTLDYESRYYVTIDSGSISDLLDNSWAGLSNKNDWNWTTITEEEFIRTGDGAIYNDLSTQYGDAANSIDTMVLSLYNALVSVIEIDDPDVKMELLQAFRSVYDTAKNGSLTSLLPVVRRLNNYILESTGNSDINDFLSSENLVVNQSWADINAIIGFNINNEHIGDPEDNNLPPQPIFTLDTPTGLIHDTSDINNEMENLCARMTWDIDVLTTAFSYEIQRKLSSQDDSLAILIGISPNIVETKRGEDLSASSIAGQTLKNEFFDFDGILHSTSYSYRVRSVDKTIGISDWTEWINNVRVKDFDDASLRSLFSTQLPTSVSIPSPRSRLWVVHLLAWNGTQGSDAYINDGWNDSKTGPEWKAAYIDTLPNEISSIINHLWRFPFGTQMYVKNDLDISISNFSGGLNSTDEWKVTGGLNPFYVFRKAGATITPPSGSGFSDTYYDLGDKMLGYLDMIKSLSDSNIRSDIYQAAPCRHSSVYSDASLMGMMQGGVHLYTRTGNIKDTSPDKRFDESNIASNLPTETPIKRFDELMFDAGIDVGGEPTFRRGQMQTFTDPLPRNIVHLLDRQRSFENTQGPLDTDYPSIAEIIKTKDGRTGNFRVWIDSTNLEWNDLNDRNAGTFQVDSSNLIDVVIARLNHGAIHGYDVMVGSHSLFLSLVNAASQAKVDELVIAMSL